MIKALLISFGLLFLVCLVAELGMDLLPRLFRSKPNQGQKEESHNKSIESDK